METTIFVVTCTDFIEEYPKKVFFDEEKATKYKEENTTEDRIYYIHKCPLIIDNQDLENLLTLFNK